MAGWNHHKFIGESRKILESFIEGKEVFAVVYKKSGKVVGSLGLHKSWSNDDAAFAHFTAREVGYVLSKDYWGKGLMPEAVRAVIKYCFDVCRLDALTCGHFLSNDRSRRVIEKCGFKFVKQDEYHAKQLQKTFEDKKYILLRQN